jgi:hypothetical protein
VDMHATDLVGINGITRVLLVYTCQQGVYLRSNVGLPPLGLPMAFLKHFYYSNLTGISIHLTSHGGLRTGILGFEARQGRFFVATSRQTLWPTHSSILSSAKGPFPGGKCAQALHFTFVKFQGQEYLGLHHYFSFTPS